MNGPFSVAAVLILCSFPIPAQGFQSLIDTWVAEDALDPPPANALLFVGSSSIRKWERLTFDFANYDVIQRGFGGAAMEDVNLYLDQIVLPYDPYAIVLYSGGNAIANGDMPEDEFARYQTFVDTIHTEQNQGRPPITIFLVGVTPSPARWSLWPQLSMLNELLGEYCATDPSLHFIDSAPAFLATGSPPAASLFAPDGLHLSPTGYALWSSVILPAVSANAPSPKVYSNNLLALKPGERLLFDFGGNEPPSSEHTASPDAHGFHWNNWPDVGGQTVVAGEHTGNLVTTAGRATDIDLVIGGGFMMGGASNGGLLAPSQALLGKFAIETATKDYFSCVNLTTPATPGSEFDEPGMLVLNNLNRMLRYDVRLFASRASSSVQNTAYALRGKPSSVKTGQVQVSGPGSGTTGNQNNDTIVTLKGVVPNTWGQVFIDVSILGNGAFAYLNAMEVIAFAAPVGG